jgi:hypothetical protein
MTCVAPKITATEARTVEITTPNVGTPVPERSLQRDRHAAADRGYGPPAADVERNVVCGLDGSTSSTEKTGLWPVLMKCSRYRTQPTAIAALPTHAVIQ